MTLTRTTTIQALQEAVLYPLRGGAGAVVVIFALLVWLALSAGILGLPLLLILVSWSAKYAFIALEHSARGHARAPVLDIDMMNPVTEMRPWYLLAICAVAFVACRWLNTRFGSVPALGLASVILFLLPAMLALLALAHSPVPALQPNRVGAVIRALGLQYLWMPAWLLTGAAAAGWLSTTSWPLVLRSALSMYLLLLVFHGTGRFLYLHRGVLGLSAERSPGRSSRKERRHDELAWRRELDTAYALQRGGRRTAALNGLQQWLNDSGADSEVRDWFCEELLGWSDPGIGLFLAQARISRLLDENDPGGAVDLCERCLRLEPAFRPAGDTATLAVARAAISAGRPGLVPPLLVDLDERFPDSALLPEAWLLSAWICWEHGNDPEQARRLLERLESRVPARLRDPRALQLAELLRAADDTARR